MPVPRLQNGALALALALCAALPAQENTGRAVFPVGDLLGSRPEPVRLLTSLAGLDPEIVCGLDEAAPLRVLSGDRELAPPPHGRGSTGAFDAAGLLKTVAALAQIGVEDLALQPETAVLTVTRERAEVVRLVLHNLRKAVPPRIRVDVRLERGVAPKTQVLVRESVEVAPGRIGVLGECEERLALVDFAVEIAGRSSIAQPIQVPVRTGAMVLVRPRFLPDNQQVLIETVTRVIDPLPAERIPTGHPGFGDLDRVAVRAAESGSVLRLAAGAQVEQRWAGPDGEPIVLTLKAAWEGGTAEGPLSPDLEYSPFGAGVASFRSVQPAAPEEDKAEDGEPGVARSFADAMFGRDDAEIVAAHEEGSPCVVGVQAGARRVREAVAAALRELTQTAAVDLHLYDVAEGATPSAGGAPPEGAKVLAQATLGVARGAWASASSAEERNVLGGWSVEVAEAARIPDPQPLRVQSGAFLNLRLDGDTLTLEGEVRRVERIETQRTPLDAATGAPAAEFRTEQGRRDTLPETHLPQDLVNLERPTVRVLPLDLRLACKPGAVVVHRRAAPALLGAQRELWIVARVRD
ncbi:MAG: hypothetical protein IT458_00760 [Planctomycetes bacterium]|nr:hypothetical protein [Planctomycetota bacterium]